MSATASTTRPAYLGDARIGDVITFRLPADIIGGLTTYTGTVRSYERQPHATGVCTVAFTISGPTARVFTCRPDLHIVLTRTTNPVE